MEDNWCDEESRSQAWNEKAQHIYELYIDNAKAYLENTKIARLHRDEDGECVEYEIPNEFFMRYIEESIDISVYHARDFRAAVIAKWAIRMKNFTSQYPMRWHEDGAMYQAISEVLRALDWANNPTIKIINNMSKRYINFNELQKPNSERKYEEVHLKYKCTCSMDTLMSTGCKCGHLERYENTR